MLRTGDFGGVQAAVDVNHHFSIAGQGASFGFACPLDQCKSARGVFVFLQIGEILGRRDHSDVPIDTQRRLADLDQLQLVG
jgi:hypothetical protein